MRHFSVFALTSLTPLFLLGCSSYQAQPNINSSQQLALYQSQHSAGLKDTQTEKLLWFDGDDSEHPQVIYERTQETRDDQSLKSDYQSRYIWKNQKLSEVRRQGTRYTHSGKAIAFTLLLRLSSQQEVVYQRLLLDGKPIALTEDDLTQIADQIRQTRALVSLQNQAGLEIYQGHWNGQEFTTCRGKNYQKFHLGGQFTQQLVPLADTYVAVLAKENEQGELYVETLLKQKAGSQDCIFKPEFEA